MLGLGKAYQYIIYAIGEILLVVIGILIALQIDNWNEEKQRRQAELIFYQNIREQVVTDSIQIMIEIEYNARYTRQFTYANSLIEQDDRIHSDTLGKIATNLLSYSDFDRQGNIYETLVNSGQLELLRNHEIIEGIRGLEDIYIYINRMENIHYDAIMRGVIPKVSEVVKFSDGRIQRPELVYSFEFQNMILTLLRIMAEKDDIYHRALRRIHEITTLIDEELGKSGN